MSKRQAIKKAGLILGGTLLVIQGLFSVTQLGRPLADFLRLIFITQRDVTIGDFPNILGHWMYMIAVILFLIGLLVFLRRQKTK